MSYSNGLKKTGIHPHVFQEYDFEVHQVDIHRSVIKVKTQLGDFAVKKTMGQPIRVEQMKEAMDFLSAQQYPVNPILPNKFGDLYVPVSDGFVYVSRWVEGNHLKLNSQPHLLSGIKAMAKLHRIGLKYTPNDLSQLPSMSEIYILNMWKQRIIWLKKYQKQLRRKSGLTTFEHVLVTYLPFLKDWAEEAVDLLEQWVIEHHSIGDQRKTICHGKFHHRNMIVHQRSFVVLDFEEVSYDTPVRDLALFIRQYILNKENRIWALDWLDVYQKTMPLNTAEKELLSILLLFPERMFSFIKGYEGKERNWSEETYLKKLQVRWGQMRELVWFNDQALK